MLDELPADVILFLLRHFLGVGEILKVSILNKKWYNFANNEVIWKYLCEESGHTFDNTKTTKITSWKELYKLYYAWVWDTKVIGSQLVVHEDLKTVWRDDPNFAASNPGLKTTKPFKQGRQLFSVKVNSLGSWISIGLSEAKFSIQSHIFVGSSAAGSFHIGYYSDSGQHNIKCDDAKYADCPRIEQNDVVSITVEDNKIGFWLQSTLLYHFRGDKTTGKISRWWHGKSFLEERLLPTVSLGKDASVTIVNKYKWMNGALIDNGSDIQRLF